MAALTDAEAALWISRYRIKQLERHKARMDAVRATEPRLKLRHYWVYAQLCEEIQARKAELEMTGDRKPTH